MKMLSIISEINFTLSIMFSFIFIALILKRYIVRRKTKIIILTGAIGVGKTTLGWMLKDYLISLRKRVYMPEEMS